MTLIIRARRPAWAPAAALVLAAGSAMGGTAREPAPGDATRTCRVQVWLEGRGEMRPGPAVHVRQVVLVGGGNRAATLPGRPGALDPGELRGRRIALAAGEVPEGTYAALRLHLEPVAGGHGGGDEAAGQKTVTVAFPDPARVSCDAAVTMLLTWDLDRGLDEPGGLRASVAGPPSGGGTVPALAVYVSDPARGRLVAVNRETLRVFAEVSVGRGAQGMDSLPDGRSVFVAVEGEDALVRVDTASQRVEDRPALKAGCGPVDVALALDATTAVVACAGSRSLAVLDVRSNAYLGDAGLGWAPRRLAAGPDGRIVYALLPEGNQVVRLDVRRAALAGGPAVVEAAPVDLAVDRVGRKIYVVHRRSPVMTVLGEDLSVERTLQLNWPAWGVALEPDGRRVYVSGGGAGGVSLVAAELGSLMREWSSPPAYRLALDPDGRKLYATGGDRGTLIVLDRVAGRLVETVEVGVEADDVLVVP